LTGGELAAAVVIDCVTRLRPGVIRSESVENESHSAGLLEYPHYTRPASFRGNEVPPVLLSGHHGEIDRWRRRKALERTAERRPDLLRDVQLSVDERAWLEALGVRNCTPKKP
jgi:tRNA (guanine37-N1)-methyltransferase